MADLGVSDLQNPQIIVIKFGMGNYISNITLYAKMWQKINSNYVYATRPKFCNFYMKSLPM